MAACAPIWVRDARNSSVEVAASPLEQVGVVAALDESQVKTVWLRSRREQTAFDAALRDDGLDVAIETAPAWPQPSDFSSTTM